MFWFFLSVFVVVDAVLLSNGHGSYVWGHGTDRKEKP